MRRATSTDDDRRARRELWKGRPLKPHALDAPPASAAQPRFAEAVRALRIVHPFPTALNVAATAALAFIAAGGTPPAERLVRMLLVMLCAQCAIGIANDVFDRDLDARTKPWKPVASGLVPPRAAVALALALIAATAVLAMLLGAGGFALALLGLACGLAYDARLKRTVLSALPFMLAVPTLPIWVWVCLDAWRPVVGWIIPLGALIGLTVHLANTFPDLEADVANGVRGLGHRIGLRRAGIAACGSFGGALALSVAIAPVAGYDLRIYAPVLLLGVACLLTLVLAYRGRPSDFALRLGFAVASVGAATLASGWLAAVT